MGHDAGDARTAGVRRTAFQHHLRGVLDLPEALVHHLEDADLVGGAEPVLGSPQDAVRIVLFPFEVQDGVDDVFEHLGPGDVAVLVDVPDDDDRDVEALRGAQEQVRAFPDLGDGAGGRGQLRERHGLDGVDDDDVRFLRVHLFGDDFDVGLAEHQQVLGRDAQAVGAKLDLVGAFLTGGVENGLLLPQRLADLQKDGGLADAGVAGQQDHRALDDAASEDAVELREPGMVPVFPDRLDLGDLLGHPSGASSESAGAGGSRIPFLFHADFFLHGVPFPALGAFAVPFRVLVPAVLADKQRLHLRCHGAIDSLSSIK